jgi:hypothetical protein
MYIVFVGLIIIGLLIIFIGIPTVILSGCNCKNNNYTEL